MVIIRFIVYRFSVNKGVSFEPHFQQALSQMRLHSACDNPAMATYPVDKRLNPRDRSLKRGKNLADHKRFEDLYKEYQPLILSLSKRYSIAGELEESISIATMAFFEAYLHFNPEKGSFGAYAKRFLRGRLLEHLKREIGFHDHNCFPAPRGRADTDWIEFIQDERTHDPFSLSDELTQALQTLTNKERMAVLHCYVWDKPLEELAQREGVSHSTASTWKRRGLAKLKKFLTACHDISA
jgi:RNA polymerase sigma factor (sigma-70 family)